MIHTLCGLLCLSAFTQHRVWRIIHIAARYLNWIVLRCVYYPIKFIRSSVSGQFGCFSNFWLLWIELCWIFVHKLLFGYFFSIILGICLGVELLGHVWGAATPSSPASFTTCFPASWGQSFFLLLATKNPNTSFPCYWWKLGLREVEWFGQGSGG